MSRDLSAIALVPSNPRSYLRYEAKNGAFNGAVYVVSPSFLAIKYLVKTDIRYETMCSQGS